MKKITIILACISLCTSCSSDSDTPEFAENIFTGNVFLETQQEVNEFGANNYTIVEGQLSIGKEFDEDDVSDLTPLIALTEINTASLRIYADLITSFEGLNNLERVNGFTVRSTTNLVNFTGLDNLTSTGNLGLNSFFNIDSNLALTSFEGLESLITIQNSAFVFGNNPVLTSLDGLNNVTELPISFISYNASCAGPYISVFCGNPMLTDFCAIQNTIINTDFISFDVDLNGYNPNLEDFENGNCSI